MWRSPGQRLPGGGGCEAARGRSPGNRLPGSGQRETGGRRLGDGPLPVRRGLSLWLPPTGGVKQHELDPERSGQLDQDAGLPAVQGLFPIKRDHWQEAHFYQLLHPAQLGNHRLRTHEGDFPCDSEAAGYQGAALQSEHCPPPQGSHGAVSGAQGPVGTESQCTDSGRIPEGGGRQSEWQL